MDKDRVKGSATNVGGKIKEGAGKLTGDQKLQGEGKVDQAKGKVRNAVGGIKGRQPWARDLPEYGTPN